MVSSYVTRIRKSILTLREGVTYNNYMSKEKAPTETPISNGALLITAEAAMTVYTFIIRLSAVNLNRRNHSDLSQLPY